jgi:predicted  nucleic acid-binding Zn-ribbon protein
MTESKERPFLGWLFGSSVAPEAQITVDVDDTHLQLAQLQREIERVRAAGLAEREAVRISRTDAEATRLRCQAELEHANRELLTMKVALESAQTEISGLALQAAEARKASARDAESLKKGNSRCSTLQFQLDKLRSELETQAKRELELEQSLDNQRAAREEAQAEVSAQRAKLLQQEERLRELEHTAARAKTELGDLESATRTQLSARQAEVEQRQKELTGARAEVEQRQKELTGARAEVEQRQKELTGARAELERLQKELKRQQASFIQASGRQQTTLDAERRAWAVWLGEVWNALLHTLGPAAPLALETYLGDLEPVAQATSTEAAEAHLREFLAVRSLCRSVAIVEHQSELRLELEPGPALEGTAAGWVGVLATRQLATMLQRPLCAQVIEQNGGLLTVHTASRAESMAVDV